MSQKFAAIGECMIEMRPDQANLYKMNFAGDTFNVALYLARYQQAVNTQVSYVTALGTDPYSTMMQQFWQQEGINTGLVQQIPERMPGLYFIHNDQHGERQFYYYRSQSAARQLFYSADIDKVYAELTQYHYLFFSGITLAIFDQFSRDHLLAVLKQAKQNGAKICFDTNYRPKLWANPQQAREEISKALHYVDIAFPTFEDEQQLFNDANPKRCAQRFLAHGVTEVIVKSGQQGATVYEPNSEQHVPAEQVKKVVDTTAAGDSFAAAYLAARIKGLAPVQAVKCGHKLASTVIAYPGAIIPQAAMPIIF